MIVVHPEQVALMRHPHHCLGVGAVQFLVRCPFPGALVGVEHPAWHHDVVEDRPQQLVAEVPVEVEIFFLDEERYAVVSEEEVLDLPSFHF